MLSCCQFLKMLLLRPLVLAVRRERGSASPDCHSPSTQLCVFSFNCVWVVLLEFTCASSVSSTLSHPSSHRSKILFLSELLPRSKPLSHPSRRRLHSPRRTASARSRPFSSRFLSPLDRRHSTLPSARHWCYLVTFVGLLCLGSPQLNRGHPELLGFPLASLAALATSRPSMHNDTTYIY